MALHNTDSKNRSCPHCGGWLYWDFEDEEWRCIGCGRRPERPISTTETPAPGPENKAPKRIAWWPKKITFGRRQILFFIKNLPQLRKGHLNIAIEIEARLEKCGLDGLVLLAIECWGESEASMANYFRMPEWSIRKRAKNALRYISGWKRKKQSYKEFLRQKLAV